MDQCNLIHVVTNVYLNEEMSIYIVPVCFVYCVESISSSKCG